MPTALPLAAIRLDDACQPRAVTDLNLAGEYAEAMLHGAAFPPVVVFGDGDGDAGYWLADGYHRWHAAEIAGLQTIAADVRSGGRREAILHSVGANAEHGWRRSNEDKRKAVLTLLGDPEWAGWSDREIARRCGVGAPLVGSLRPKPSVIGLQIDPERPSIRKAIRNGTEYAVSTAGINADRRRPEPEPDYPLREDPRQLDIEDAAQADAEEAWQEMHRDDPPAAPEYVYDAEAGRLSLRISELVEKLSADSWPRPSAAIEAWMQGRGYGPSVEDVRRAADWMQAFASLYEVMEPLRLQAVEAMLNRAKELTHGAE